MVLATGLPFSHRPLSPARSGIEALGPASKTRIPPGPRCTPPAPADIMTPRAILESGPLFEIDGHSPAAAGTAPIMAAFRAGTLFNRDAPPAPSAGGFGTALPE